MEASVEVWEIWLWCFSLFNHKNIHTVDFPAPVLQQTPQNDEWDEAKVWSWSHESHNDASCNNDLWMLAWRSGQHALFFLLGSWMNWNTVVGISRHPQLIPPCIKTSVGVPDHESEKPFLGPTAGDTAEVTGEEIRPLNFRFRYWSGVPSSNASNGTKLSANWLTAMKVLLLSHECASVASTTCTHLFAKVHTVFQRRIILFYSKHGGLYVPPTLLSAELAPWISLSFMMVHLQKPTRQIGHALIQKTMQNHHAHRNGRWFRHNRDKKCDLNDFIFRSCPVLFIPVSLESTGCFAILCSKQSWEWDFSPE